MRKENRFARLVEAIKYKLFVPLHRCKLYVMTRMLQKEEALFYGDTKEIT